MSHVFVGYVDARVGDFGFYLVHPLLGRGRSLCRHCGVSGLGTHCMCETVVGVSATDVLNLVVLSTVV